MKQTVSEIIKGKEKFKGFVAKLNMEGFSDVKASNPTQMMNNKDKRRSVQVVCSAAP